MPPDAPSSHDRVARTNGTVVLLVARGGWRDCLVMLGAARFDTKDEARGRATTLLELLTEKFGSSPADLETAIRGTTDLERLRAWTSAAIKPPTLEEFRRIAGL